jgi:hypothetical protein
MVTTSRLVPLDAVGRAEQDLIHLTGPLQVVVRAEIGDAGNGAARADLRFDAGRVRGLGLKSGARYWVQGLHQSTYQSGSGRAPFEVTALFELLSGALESTQTGRLVLAVRFRVMIPADGRMTVEAAGVELLPDRDLGSSSLICDTQQE